MPIATAIRSIPNESPTASPTVRPVLDEGLALTLVIATTADVAVKEADEVVDIKVVGEAEEDEEPEVAVVTLLGGAGVLRMPAPSRTPWNPPGMKPNVDPLQHEVVPVEQQYCGCVLPLQRSRPCGPLVVTGKLIN